MKFLVLVIAIAVVGASEVDVDKKREKEVCISAAGTTQCFPVKRGVEEKCEPGDQKKIACNDCFCAGVGEDTFWLCTLRGCLDVNRVKKEEKTIEAKRGGPCMSGKMYKIDCNWCQCDGGEWLCTLKQCENKREIEPKSEEPLCMKEEDYKMNGCNQCICLGGHWMCTQRMCHSIGKREEIVARETCPRENDVKMKSCNTCLCLDGEWMCTYRMCRAMGKREAASPNAGLVAAEEKRGKKMDCFRGEKKKDGCNRCICIGGSWGCTLNYC